MSEKIGPGPCYIILNLENFGVDAELIEASDLMLLKLNSRKCPYRILRNGVKISYYLNQFLNRHEYRIVLCFTDRKRQMQMITNLEKTIFPRVTAIAVKDPDCFNGIKSNRPQIFKASSHQMRIAGYSDYGGATHALEALSAMFSISENERKNHIVIDTDLPLIETASKEGWRTYHITRDLLLDTLIEILQPLTPSSQEFVLLKNEEVKHGCSPNRGWYIHKITGKKWFGKTSLDSIFPPKDKPSGYSLYKEYLAGIFYSVLGVATPATALSEQMLNESEAENYGVANSFTRLHLMSQFVDGFVELGPDFVKNYKNFEPKTSYFQVTEKRLPLRGLGRTLAIAILLHDYDCIGNSGANMGYVIKDDHAEIVKIDPGEALSFAEDMSGAKELENHPKDRKAIIGTQLYEIHFDELTKEDQAEFARTVEMILQLPDAYIEEVMKEFLEMDEIFRIVLDKLLERKNNLLGAFSTEMREALLKQMQQFEKKKVQECIKHWDNPRKLPKLLETDAHQFQLIDNSSRLEAAETSLHGSNSTIKFQIPHSHYGFIGREEELREMKKRFDSSDKKITCIAIVGTAGLGKTQLAVEYVTSNEEKYSHIIWFNGEKGILLLPQILNYITIFVDPKFRWMVSSAKEYGRSDPSSKSYLLNRFYQSFKAASIASTPQKACLVIDNAEDMEGVADYLPSSTTQLNSKLDIIITSRYKEWKSPIEKIFHLKAFSDEETKKYISIHLDKKESGEEIKTLNGFLKGLPIAVKVAIASMKKQNERISDYLNKICSNNTEILKVEESDVFRRQLIIALAELCQKNDQVKRIMDIIAYLAPEHITVSDLFDCWKGCYEVKKGEECEFNRGLDLLELHSIISRSKSNQDKRSEIEIHRLTQEIVRSIHMKGSKVSIFSTKLLCWLQLKIKFYEEDIADIERIKSGHLITHAIYWSELEEFKDINNFLKIFDEEYCVKFADLLRRIAFFYQEIVGDYAQAKKYSLRAFEIREKCNGTKNILLCDTLMYLTYTCELLDQHEDQKKFSARVVEIYQDYLFGFKALLNLNPQKAKSEIQQFITKGDDRIIRVGRYSSTVMKICRECAECLDQRPLIIRVLELFDEDYNETSAANFRILTCLGLLWGCLGELGVQEEFWIRAEEMCRKIYGNDHINVGHSLYMMSALWKELKNYEKVRDNLNEAFEILLNLLGDNHPFVAMVAMELADAYGHLGNYDQKIIILLQAMDIFKRAYNEEHIHVAQVLTELAEVYGKLGDIKAKSEALEKALTINENYYGKEHPETKKMRKIFKAL
mgnify:CR=1 FL=1